MFTAGLKAFAILRWWRRKNMRERKP